MILVVAIGALTYIQLPKRDIPEITQDLVSIQVVYPGASPESVERTITNPLEEALMNINGIEDMASTSTTGFSNITLVLSSDVDEVSLNQRINQQVSRVQSNFPDDVRAVNINTDLIQTNVATYHVLADEYETLLEARESIDVFKTDLMRINGVREINVKGLPEQYLSIQIDPEALAQNQLQPNDVIETVTRLLQPVALGSESSDGEVRTLNLSTYNTLEDFDETIITASNGDTIRLGDVTLIEVTDEDPTDLIHDGGQYAVSVTVVADDGVNVLNLEAPLAESFSNFNERLPEELSARVYFSQTEIIDDVYSSLIQSLIISLVAVMVIMVLGLPLQAAILVALAIPLSMIIGLIPLPFFGVDLNQISVIGIIVAIGILVDDAIVMNDNIERRYKLGDQPLAGILNAVKEVRVSIITSTLLIVFSFVPLTFLSGSNGDFIRALPLALVFTVLASTFLALSFIPAVRYSLRKRKPKSSKRSGLLDGLFAKLSDLYGDRVIPFSLKHPIITISSGLLVTVLFISLFLFVPFEFFPAAEREEVTITATLAEGTSLEATRDTLIDIEAYLEETHDTIRETSSYAGTGLPPIFGSTINGGGSNTGQVVVRIDQDKTKVLDFIEQAQVDLIETFDTVELEFQTIMSGPPASADIEVELSGDDLAELSALSDELYNELDTLASTLLVQSNTRTQPFTDFVIDEDQMASYDFTYQQVTGLMQLANIGAPVGTFDDGNTRLPIEIRYGDNANGLDLTQLELASFTEESPMPMIISLDTFIDRVESDQISAIQHLNGDRTVTLSVFTDGNTDEANAVIENFTSSLPSGYQLNESGETDSETAFFLEVAQLFLVVLFLIYTTLAIQFNSLTTPILISFTIILAVAGAIVGLFISGEPLSFLAVLGIVALSGVIVRNAILLIEFIEQNRNTYGTLQEAFVEAGRLRLKPILLTTMTSMAALIPIIIGGDVLFTPLAVSIVYGIFFATLLTLVLLPPLYLALLKLRKEV